MSDTTIKPKPFPVCDLCCVEVAYADAKIPGVGSWGNVCKTCFDINRCKLGTGNGQRFVTLEEANNHGPK